MSSSNDNDLRSRFDRLRDETANLGASFHASLARARARGERKPARRSRGVLLGVAATAAVVMIGVAFLVVPVLRPAPTEEPPWARALPTSWSVATDELLVTPGLQLTEPDPLAWHLFHQSDAGGDDPHPNDRRPS